MTQLLELAAGIAPETLARFFLVFLRVGAMMTFLPAFGEQAVPVRIRLAIALAFTFVAAPAVDQGLPAGVPAILAAGLAEVLAGLAWGFALRLGLYALQIAGAVAANATSLSQLFGGVADPQPAISNLLVWLALAAGAGLHVNAAGAIILSYEVFPPGAPIPALDLSRWITIRTGAAFASAVTLAAPFLLLSLIYNLALGAINRAMPQLMVALVGAPAITMAGLGLLFLTAPFVVGIWLDGYGAALGGAGLFR